jgi:hypothetical protein
MAWEEFLTLLPIDDVEDNAACSALVNFFYYGKGVL